MKFLLIGNGFIIPSHKQTIKSIGGEIVSIVDKDQGEGRWKEEVKKTNADCVVVLTPNDLHFEMAELAAEQGKVVLCEKPLTFKSEQTEVLTEKDNIFTVLQLRYHPFVEKIRTSLANARQNLDFSLRSELKQEQLVKNVNHKIEMNIYFKRDDEKYINGWKNKKERSGGFLFNLGIHYFDLLIHLFGEPKNIEVDSIYERNDSNPEASASGIIKGDNYTCKWRMYINKKEVGQIIKKREFVINGTSYNFSSKDNLAEENLHKFVYQDLLNGKGITPQEALKSIKLIEQIYEKHS